MSTSVYVDVMALPVIPWEWHHRGTWDLTLKHQDFLGLDCQLAWVAFLLHRSFFGKLKEAALTAVRSLTSTGVLIRPAGDEVAMKMRLVFAW